MTEEILKAQRRNLRRFCQLLATDLTPQERMQLHARIKETRHTIEQLGSEKEHSGLAWVVPGLPGDATLGVGL